MAKVLSLLLFILLFAVATDTSAQCVMCKAVAEDAAASGSIGRGLNTAILYLMAIPYLILTTLYFFFFRKKRKFT